MYVQSEAVNASAQQHQVGEMGIYPASSGNWESHTFSLRSAHLGFRLVLFSVKRREIPLFKSSKKQQPSNKHIQNVSES